MRASDVTAIESLLVSPSFSQDPYPIYAMLRETDPVHFVDAWGAWVVTTYLDCLEIFRDPMRFSNRARFESFLQRLPREAQHEVQDVVRHNSVGMLQSDPPEHTRLRRLVQAAFTPRVVTDLRPRVKEIINALIDRIEDEGRETDLIRSFAFPLPVRIICELLGVPEEDHERIGAWARDISALQATGTPQYERAKLASQKVVEIEGYFQTLGEERRRRPREDLISRLIAVRDEGDRLSQEELINMCVNLVFAGHETTTALIGNAVYTLLTHPDQIEAVRADPSLISGSVEECLRYESAVQRGWRRVARDTTYRGRAMRAGQLVYLMIGAANRDPAGFSDPDRFDIGRSNNRHLAFGSGVHFCIGAPLARLEAATALDLLFQRLPRLEMVDAGPWAASIHIRVLAKLKVIY